MLNHTRNWPLLTLLDPRFKDKVFTDLEARSKACRMLGEYNAEISNDLEEVTQSQEPLPKCPRPEILKWFTDILEQLGVMVRGSSSVTEME